MWEVAASRLIAMLTRQEGIKEPHEVKKRLNFFGARRKYLIPKKIDGSHRELDTKLLRWLFLVALPKCGVVRGGQREAS